MVTPSVAVAKPERVEVVPTVKLPSVARLALIVVVAPATPATTKIESPLTSSERNNCFRAVVWFVCIIRENYFKVIFIN